MCCRRKRAHASRIAGCVLGRGGIHQRRRRRERQREPLPGDRVEIARGVADEQHSPSRDGLDPHVEGTGAAHGAFREHVAAEPRRALSSRKPGQERVVVGPLAAGSGPEEGDAHADQDRPA